MVLDTCTEYQYCSLRCKDMYLACMGTPYR